MKKGSEGKKTEKSQNDISKRPVAKKNKCYIAEKKNVRIKKDKKDNIFKRITKYFKGVFKEFKRIRWTDGKDLVKYSICTLMFVLFFGLYFYGIDWVVLLIRSLAN